MKRVLIISYYFPPAGGSAVQRVLKFVKYFPLFGWQPMVLTAKPEYYSLKDESLLSDIPENLFLKRVKAPDPYGIYAILMKKEKADAELVSLSGSSFSIAQRIFRFFRAAFFIPDARIGWFPFAFWKAKKIIDKYKPDVLFTTAPPFTAALLGGCLKKCTGIPWVSDYRDPWTDAYFYIKRPRISTAIERRLEKHLLKIADKVVTVNRSIFNDLKNKYNLPAQNKNSVIYNGYDPADYSDIQPVKEKKFTIVYTGTVNSKMHPASLFNVISVIKKRSPELADNILFKFIGRIGSDVKKIFESPDIKKTVKTLPYIPHSECLRHTAGADILLLLEPDIDNMKFIGLSNKLFEYMFTGKPVLCLSESSEVADIVRSCGAGLSVSPNKTGQIADWLIKQYENITGGVYTVYPKRNEKKISEFNRISQTELLTNLFNEIDKKNR